jgi:hypothetical protein
MGGPRRGTDLQNTTVSVPDDLYATNPYPPPKDNTPPDLTDDAVRKARLDQLSRLLGSRGRRSTFLTGPNGAMDMSTPAANVFKTKLGGY